MVKLRLKRFGKKRNATYRIVAIDSRSRRQGRPLQELGFYNPRSKETVLQAAEILKWMRQGAQATETLEVILRKAGIYDLLASGTELPTEPIRIAAQVKATAVIDAPVEVEPAEGFAVAETASSDAESETDAETSEDDTTEALADEAVEA